MPREKIALSVEETPTGIRYKRMVRGKVFKSKVYPNESRENKREAWNAFCTWRESAPEPATIPRDNLSLVRDLLTEQAVSVREHSEMTGDPKGVKTMKRVLGLIPNADEKLLHELLARLINNPVAEDRIKTAKRISKSTDIDLTARVVADEFVAGYRRKAETGRGSWGRHGQVKPATDLFVEWFGATRSLENLSEQVVKNYYAYLEQLVVEGKQGRTTISAYQDIFQTFIQAAAEDAPDEIKIPTNLRSKRLKIHKDRKEPKTFTGEEVKILLAQAVPRTKLFLLLMLNCAMYQGDSADLLADEVDWRAGRIIRPRSKRRRQAATMGEEAPIKTNWLLWRTTFDLLKQIGCREGVVLRQVDGESLLINHTASSRNDAIRSAYRRLVAKCKRRELLPQSWHKTLKQFRKTGANLLEKSEEHLMTYRLYLAHSTAKDAYLTSGEPVPQFDAAIRWLGNELGIE